MPRGGRGYGLHTRNPGWKNGEVWVCCQRCGFDYYQSFIKVEWNGAIVCETCWEPRQPQDFVRGVHDRMAPSMPFRPCQDDLSRAAAQEALYPDPKPGGFRSQGVPPGDNNNDIDADEFDWETFDPTTIGDAGNPVLWLDLHDPSTLYENLACTDPAEYGDNLQCADNKGSWGTDMVGDTLVPGGTVQYLQANSPNGRDTGDLSTTPSGFTVNEPDTIDGAFTLFVACQNPPASGSDRYLSDTTVLVDRNIVLFDTSNSDRLTWLGPAADITDTGISIAGAANVRNHWAVYTAQHSRSPTRFSQLYYNGSKVGSQVDMGDLGLPTSGISHRFFNDGFSGGSDWGGQAGEILLYEGELSQTEIQQVNGYLQAKWGITQ